MDDKFEKLLNVCNELNDLCEESNNRFLKTVEINTQLFEENIRLNEKLNKTKKLIKELLDLINYLNEDEIEDFSIVHKAEEFLLKGE